MAEAAANEISTPMETPRPSRPVTPMFESDVEGISTPPLRPRSSHQPLITPLQREMVRALDTLPQLERVVAWFPRAFNAHAVIIARNARNPKWAWQVEGRQVVQVWARKVVAAASEAVEMTPSTQAA